MEGGVDGDLSPLDPELAFLWWGLGLLGVFFASLRSRSHNQKVGS